MSERNGRSLRDETAESKSASKQTAKNVAIYKISGAYVHDTHVSPGKRENLSAEMPFTCPKMKQELVTRR